MDANDLSVMQTDFRGTSLKGYLVTFRDASRTGKDADPPPYTYCLDSGYASGLVAVHLQRIIEDWEDVLGRVENKEPAPSNVDAMYSKGGVYHLIEFKDNQITPLKKFKHKLYDKANDSIDILIKHGVKSAEYYKQESVYIVVATKVHDRSDADLARAACEHRLSEDESFDEMFGPPEEEFARPWSIPGYVADAGLGCWNGVIYRQALTLTPMQFNNYAEDGSWS